MKLNGNIQSLPPPQRFDVEDEYQYLEPVHDIDSHFSQPSTLPLFFDLDTIDYDFKNLHDFSSSLQHPPLLLCDFEFDSYNQNMHGFFPNNNIDYNSSNGSNTLTTEIECFDEQCEKNTYSSDIKNFYDSSSSLQQPLLLSDFDLDSYQRNKHGFFPYNVVYNSSNGNNTLATDFESFDDGFFEEMSWYKMDKDDGLGFKMDIDNRLKETKSIKLEDIRKEFWKPITKAAKAMRVGLTVLKKRCRKVGIKRWPNRKLKSLSSLIIIMKEMGLKADEVKMVEENLRMIEDDPRVEISDRTKKLRQACFKENYKKRRVQRKLDFIGAPYGIIQQN